MKQGLVLSVLLLTVLALIAFPVFSARFEFPDPKGYVNDYADVLANDSELETQLSDFAKSDSTEIFVITLETLPDTVTIDTFIPYLTDEHPQWRAGQEKYDNGVIFTIVTDTHDVRIDTGYGVEGALPDITAKLILETDVVPKFRAGDFGGGVEAGVDGIIEAVRGEYLGSPAETLQPVAESVGDLVGGFGFTLLFFIVPMLGSFLGRTKSWWLGGVLGFVTGAIGAVVCVLVFPALGWIRFLGIVLGPLGLGVAGLVFDYYVSKTFNVQKGGSFGRIVNRTLGSSRLGGWGGFSGGRAGGGGFGGGSGGSFGGGGASSKW